MNYPAHIRLRKARESDVSVILDLIRELALFEKAPDEVTITVEELKKDGFGNNPLFQVILAEDENGNILGMSFYYIAYSTWKGKCLYLEDIIVREKYRGQGIGSLLFDATLVEAQKMNAARMMWQVLDWNQQAIDFYREKYGAEISSEWLNGRLRREQIHLLCRKIKKLPFVD